MWVKKLDANEMDVTFMSRELDPLDGKRNPYDNMVVDEEDFDEVTIEPSGLRFEVIVEVEDTIPVPTVLHEEKPVLTTSEEEACWDHFLGQ